MQNIFSWGRYPQSQANITSIYSIEDFKDKSLERPFLPIGLKRSYGDSCLNHNEHLFDMTQLSHFVHFDKDKGQLKAHAGVSFDEILQLIVPQGWFLPVTPGTKFITLGGAIANDVHGKNHHQDGCFGRFVMSFEILRSNGDRVLCSPTQNSDLFRATIGGLGLTGIILWAEIQLKKITNSFIDCEIIKFNSLEEFHQINQESQDFLYTVSWLDCLNKDKKKYARGRGLFIRGNHSQDKKLPLSLHQKSKWSMPTTAPRWLLNNSFMKTFNFLYFHKQLSKKKSFIQHYDPFFYPLDFIRHWNLIYGRDGFFQYQCVLPFDKGQDVLKEMLKLIAHSSQGSFLSVLKTFGEVSSPGLLSFPQPGITLCLDFSNLGPKTLLLLKKLDEMVLAQNGRLYPAKDARMSAQAFTSSYPDYQKFLKYKDPHCISSFWKRVTLKEQ